MTTRSRRSVGGRLAVDRGSHSRCRDNGETILAIATLFRYERRNHEALLMGERALLKAVAAGDSAAFERLHEEHIDSVYRCALQMLRSVSEAGVIA